MECGGSLKQAFMWISVDEGCEPYYSFGDDYYPTLEALADAQNCQEDCVWQLSQAVMVIGCVGGNRTEYMTYRADGEGCETLYQVESGLLRNICMWQERVCFCKDGDGDFVSDGRPDGEALGGSDNCDDVPNPTQWDTDGDYFGDACDPDIDGDGTPNGSDDDIDGDLFLNAEDSCPNSADPVMDCDGDPLTPDERCDADDDGTTDACDACAYDATNDADADGVCEDLDNCPGLPNAPSDCDDDALNLDEQCDGDLDGIGDACDDDL